MTVRLMLKGLIAGLLTAGAIALWDAVSGRGYLFGLKTAIFGLPAGGMMLVTAFLMAVASYWMATRNLWPTLRQRLLGSAIFTGVAGLSCGTACFALWAAMGAPLFP